MIIVFMKQRKNIKEERINLLWNSNKGFVERLRQSRTSLLYSVWRRRRRRKVIKVCFGWRQKGKRDSGECRNWKEKRLLLLFMWRFLLNGLVLGAFLIKKYYLFIYFLKIVPTHTHEREEIGLMSNYLFIIMISVYSNNLRLLDISGMEDGRTCYSFYCYHKTLDLKLVYYGSDRFISA